MTCFESSSHIIWHTKNILLYYLLYSNISSTGYLLLSSDWIWSLFPVCQSEEICHWQTDTLMCKSYQCQRRIQGGWSCTVSPHHTSGRPHPSLHAHRTKCELTIKDSQISLVWYILIKNVSSIRRLRPGAINPFWAHAVYSAALFVTHCCSVGDVLWITPSCADIFLQWVMASELPNSVRSGGEIDPSCWL